DRDDPYHPINRRISIIVMTRDAEDRFFAAGNAAEPLPAANAEAEEKSPESPPNRATRSSADTPNR
ncbi:MAG: hypothetical protein RL722_2564, partial [Pseudomonadota bacterium]